MQIHPEFPQHRRQDPRRRSEATVYDQLARSEIPGHVLYELKASPKAPEVDFALWVEDEGRFGIQVKGGHYSLEDTQWRLHTAAGADLVACPLTQTWDGAIGIRDALYRSLKLKIFLIPILLLTDMEPDPTIEEWAASGGRVRVLWGYRDLVNRLLEVAHDVGVKYPPTAEHIRREVEAVTAGLVLPDAAAPPPAEPAEPEGRQLIIQHIDTLNVYVTPAEAGSVLSHLSAG